MRGAAGSAVVDPGLFFRLVTVITLTGGTIFLMWLGEQVTQRGVGNGISLIIFAGIVANLPTALASTLELGRTGALPRSEESRVGKECVSTCRSRWSTNHSKKKHTTK